MSEVLGKNKKELLKGMIEQLHQGADPQKIKAEFRTKIGDISPMEIAQIEEELIKEGMTKEEIQQFCDVHLALFQESLEKEEHIAPAGHPIHILMEEHRVLLEYAGELRDTAKGIMNEEDIGSAADKMGKLDHLVEHFKASSSHYLREENVLFPYLEKHGITQPPAVMWMEHDRIREIEKGLFELADTRENVAFRNFANQLDAVSLSLADILSNHFYKENNILYTTAMRVMEEDEWRDTRRQFDEIGYCCFTPEPARTDFGDMKTEAPKPESEGVVSFDSGTLSKEELEAVLNTLPVDITFVDKNDKVKYFSQSKDRIFVRTKAVIGREVRQCHPEKSIHVVNQILEDFKSGNRDVAEFWIDLDGRLIYIQYFPVRGANGEYIGCIEVSRDITDIKKIEGEKRLL